MDTHKNNPKEKLRAVEGILRRWDPVGVKPGQFAPEDEYNGYAPQIVSLVENGCSSAVLAAHLEHLSVHKIGVGSNVRASTKFAAEIMRTLRAPAA